MKERPILFSGLMVNALLAGRKTQTRRVVKLPRPVPAGDWYADRYNGTQEWGIWQRVDGQDTGRLLSPELITCPYGQPGDRLWVRENTRVIGWGHLGEVQVEYPADGATLTRQIPLEGADRFAWERWNERMCEKAEALGATYANDGALNLDGIRFPVAPSIHMPRWASRLSLEITAVRLERLQAISEADAQAEGARRAWERQDGYTHYDDQHTHPGFTYRNGFHGLWCDINGESNWDANPFVWVVAFKVVTA